MAPWRIGDRRVIVPTVFDSLRHSASRRAPDNELYDHACDLVEATAAIAARVAQALVARAAALN